jgi:hypothetical protein
VEHVTVQVKNGVLIVDDDFDDHVILDPQLEFKAEITLTTLDAVTLEGTGGLVVEGAWQTEEATLLFSGTGDVQVDDLQAEVTTLKADGTGSITMAGQTDTLDLDCSGTGDVNLGDFLARAITMSADGTGSVIVHATEEISGDASGTGSITIRGNPQTRDLSTSGTGSVDFE